MEKNETGRSKWSRDLNFADDGASGPSDNMKAERCLDDAKLKCSGFISSPCRWEPAKFNLGFNIYAANICCCQQGISAAVSECQ